MAIQPEPIEQFYLSIIEGHRSDCLSRVFQSDLITIIVGPSKTGFAAHKAILTKVRYFTRCLEGERFLEGTDKEIILREEIPETFAKILEYLYFGKVEARTFDTDVREEPERVHMTLLAKLYVAVDMYCM